MEKNQTRFEALDAFRGICACLVALSHFHANSILSGYTLVDFGSVYVDFFFVLSGFVIFANYQEKLRHGYSIGKFMFLRFFRLYPLHFFMLMAFTSVVTLQWIFPLEKFGQDPFFTEAGESFRDFIANLFLVHSLNVSHEYGFNSPSWSISVEFYAYLFFALLLSFSGRFYRWSVFLAGIVSAIALYLIAGELYAKLNFGFLRCVYGFSCGALLWNFKAYIAQNKFFTFRKQAAHFLEVLLFLGTCIYIQYFSSGPTSMLAPLVFSVLILLFSFEKGIISQILLTPAFQLLGALSYSIYMLHVFICTKFFELPIRLFKDWLPPDFMVMENGLKTYGNGILSGSLLEIFYLLVVIGCSYISYHLIEEPFRLWSKRYLKKSENKAAV